MLANKQNRLSNILKTLSAVSLEIPEQAGEEKINCSGVAVLFLARRVRERVQETETTQLSNPKY